MNKTCARKKRHKKLRKKIFGTASKPRLCVFRSNKNIYSQIINDEIGHTLASASTLNLEFENNEQGLFKRNKNFARKIGQCLAELAKKLGITEVVFDRNGYKYHGIVKELANGARDGGLLF